MWQRSSHRAPRITIAYYKPNYKDLYGKLSKIDIKRYIKTAIKVYIPHKKLCLCCFVTVSCPINAILASFNVLVSQLLRKIPGKNLTVLRCQTKKLQKLPSFHSDRSQTSLESANDKRLQFLINKLRFYPSILTCQNFDQSWTRLSFVGGNSHYATKKLDRLLNLATTH